MICREGCRGGAGLQSFVVKLTLLSCSVLSERSDRHESKLVRVVCPLARLA